MARSGYTCVRHIFCWLNIFLWITGSAVFGVGLWLRFAYEGYASLMPQYAFLSTDSLAIAAGTVTLLITFFACCGSWFQNRCMLITYFALVVFIFIVEFLLGAIAFLFRTGISHTLREELQNGLWHHYNVTARGPNSLVTIWDDIQEKFRCCGVRDYQDWFMIDAWPHMPWTPDSCCLPALAVKYCGRSGDATKFYAQGCYEQIHMWFLQRLHLIGVVCLMITFIQLFGLIASMLLFCTVRHKRTSRTYKSYQSH